MKKLNGLAIKKMMLYITKIMTTSQNFRGGGTLVRGFPPCMNPWISMIHNNGIMVKRSMVQSNQSIGLLSYDYLTSVLLFDQFTITIIP